MKKLLIADGSEKFCDSLVELLQQEFEIATCTDGNTASELMRSFRPNIMILDLMLPGKDGLTILEECKDILPHNILAVTDFTSDYINQAARDLGVSLMIHKPCLPHVIVSRLHHLMNHTPVPEFVDNQSKVAKLLLEFGFNPKLNGFRFLKVAVPIFAQNTNLRVCKEVYIPVAKMCGVKSWNQVERSIRSAIESTWSVNSDYWSRFFHNDKAAPTGKQFISLLANMLTV